MQSEKSTYAEETLAGVDALLARRYPQVEQSVSISGAHLYQYQGVCLSAVGDVHAPNKILAHGDGVDDPPCYIGLPAGTIASDIVAYLAIAEAGTD